MKKHFYSQRMEWAKDDTPSTGWFIQVVALLFGGVWVWCKIKGAL